MKNKTKIMTLAIILLSLFTVLTNSVYSGEKLVSVAKIVSESDLVTSRLKSFIKNCDFTTAIKGDAATTNSTNLFQVLKNGKLIVPTDNKKMEFDDKGALQKRIFDFYNELATMLVVILMDSDAAVAQKIRTDYPKFKEALDKADTLSTFLWRTDLGASTFLKKDAKDSSQTFTDSMLFEILKLFGERGKLINTEMEKISIAIPELDLETNSISQQSASFVINSRSSLSSQVFVTEFLNLSKKVIDIAGLESIEVKDSNLVGHTRTLTRKLKISEDQKYLPFNENAKIFGEDVAKVIATSKDNTKNFTDGYNTGSGENKITTSVVKECSKDTQTTTEKTINKLTQPVVLGPLAGTVGLLGGTGIGFAIFGDKSEKSTTESTTQTEPVTESTKDE